jgi:hypothetical protein
MTADLAVPTFTKNVKVGQPPPYLCVIQSIYEWVGHPPRELAVDKSPLRVKPLNERNVPDSVI